MSKGGKALGALLCVAVLSACSGSANFSIGGQSVDEAGEELIEGDLAEVIGLGPLTPDCPAVEDPEVGTTFSCSATTEDGETILFDGVVDREDHINLETTNVVIPDNFERVFFETLNDQNPDLGLTADGVDCGDIAFVIEAGTTAGSELTCEVQPATGQVQVATLTINDLTTGDIDYAFQPTETEGETGDTNGGDTNDGDTNDGETEAAQTETESAEGQDDQSQTSGADQAAVAQATLITQAELGSEWLSEPRPDDDVDYRSIDGCAPLAELIENDGHLTEAESPQYSNANTSFTHDVRVYADEATAIDTIAQWAEQLVLDCTIAGSEQQAAEGFANGDLDGWEEISFDLQAYQDLEDEPRFTNLELNNTLTDANGDELLVVNDLYFLQIGRIVSSVLVTNVGGTWEETTALLDLIVERMVNSNDALQSS